MFIPISLLEAIIYIVKGICSIFSIIVIISCLMSWFRPDPYNPIVQLINNLTEPFLWRIRKYLPFVYTRGFDFSPIVLLGAVYFVETVVIKGLVLVIVSLK